MNQRRSRALLAVAVMVVLVAAVLLTNVFPYRKILAQQQQVTEAQQQQLGDLQAENERLEGETLALATDSEIERLARENLGYVRPGELAYVVLEPPITDATVIVEPVELPVEPDAWYENLWSFLTGKDLLDS